MGERTIFVGFVANFDLFGAMSGSRKTRDLLTIGLKVSFTRCCASPLIVGTANQSQKGFGQV